MLAHRAQSAKVTELCDLREEVERLKSKGKKQERRLSERRTARYRWIARQTGARSWISGKRNREAVT